MEMKTIKQVADELGISKNKVKYQVVKLTDDLLVKKDGIIYITNEGFERLKELLVVNSPVINHSSTGELTTFNHQLTTILTTQITTLEKQLEVKDKQINELQESRKKELETKDKQIEELQKSNLELVKVIDQEQQLRLLDKQKIMELEQGKETEENVSEDKPKSFFERIMGSLRG